MADCFAAQADSIAAGRKCAQSGTSKNIKYIGSTLPRCIEKGLIEVLDGPDGEVVPHSKSRTQTLQALAVVRGHCAMKPADRAEEDGKKALTYNCATAMTAPALSLS
jgi:hypothetical protein